MTDFTAAQGAHPQSRLRVRSHRWTIMLYGAAVFLYWIALYLYVPTLPVYAQTKTDDLALIGVVLSMYGLWQALVRLPLGIAVDWLGWRKPFLLFGLGLAALGAWMMGTASGVGDMLVGRAITGLAAGTWVPLVVVFSALFPPREAVRASTLLTLIGSVGRILATSLTGPLNDLGGYSLAFFLAMAAAGLAALMVLPAGETRHPRRRPSVGGTVRLITRRDVALPSLLAMVAQYANWSATFGFVPLLAKGLGADNMFLSVMITLNLAVFTAGNLATISIVNRIGARRLATVSFTLLFMGIAGLAIAPDLRFLLIAQLCVGLSQGIGYPVLMGLSIRFVDDAQRTTAMGLHQAVYAIGMFAGPWLSGILADAMGIRPMFGVTAFACLALGLAGAHGLSPDDRWERERIEA